jgi:hypothetical protein
MMSHFLTNENGQFILELLHRFLLDKYKFRIQSVMNEPQLRKLLETTMVTIYKNNDKNTPLEQLNKITISDLKEFFKERYSLNIVIDVPKEPLIPIPEEPILETVGLSEDSDFLNKVQMLEFQRKTFQIPPAAATSQNNLPPNLDLINSSIINPSPIPQGIPQSISTIYMPMPPKIGTEIFIHSWQREWIYSHGRASFTWNGPLPKMQDTHVRIGCWMGSSSILTKTSYLNILIQAAGGEQQTISLIPTYTCGSHVIYKPALDTLGYIKLFSLPWKITLRTTDHIELDLGKDGDVYEKYERQSINNNLHTLLYITNPKNYHIGDNIRIMTVQNQTIICNIININKDTIEINQPVYDAGYILNFTEQFSLLIELTSGDHRPIRM